MLFKRLLRPFAYNNEISRAVNDIMVETDKISESITTLRKDVDGTFNDVNISGTHLVFDKVGGEQKEIELPDSSSEWVSIATLNDIDTEKITKDTIITASNLPTNKAAIILQNVVLHCTNIETSSITFNGPGACYSTSTTPSSYYSLARFSLSLTGKTLSFTYIIGTTATSGSVAASATLTNGYIKY